MLPSTWMSDPGSRTISLDPDRGGISIPRLYFALLRQRFTGTLTLTQREPAGARSVWFRGGMPVFTDWQSDPDRLGELLVRVGLLDAAGLERALTAHASGNGLLGEILVGLELISDAVRIDALRDQCARKLVHGFARDSLGPEVTVNASEHDEGKADGLAQINVLALLLRGVSEHFDDQRIRAELGSALAGDLVTTPAMPKYERQFGFEPGDAPILSALARGVTMSRLLTPSIDPTRARQIVYTLWAAQMLRVGDDAVQAIAKGATAAAAAQKLGVTIGMQSQMASSRPRAKPTTGQPAPKPAASKPEPKPSAATRSAATRSAAPPAPEPEPADDGFEAGLVALEAKIADEAHAFALFGLELDAERKQIRAVWAELSKAYHPDALEGAGRSGLRERVERVFAALSEAYGVLSDKTQREQLREALSASGGTLKAGEDTAAVVRNAFEAELIARDADKLLKAREWARAAELFGRAHALSPKDSDIEAALLYAEFRRGDASDAASTITKLAKVVEDTPNCARAYYFKGLVELGVNASSAAKQSFATAHELDPRNIDAERQLRAIKLRERGSSASKSESKDDKKRGFGLRGLFKKD